MSGFYFPTTTDRNRLPAAESLRHFQGTTLGMKRSSLEYQAGELEALRSLRKVIRCAVTKLMYEATEIRQAHTPSTSDLLEAIRELLRKDAELYDLNARIGEMLEVTSLNSVALTPCYIREGYAVRSVGCDQP